MKIRITKVPRQPNMEAYGGYLDAKEALDNAVNLFGDGGGDKDKKDDSKFLRSYLLQRIKHPNGRNTTKLERFLNYRLDIPEEVTAPWFEDENYVYIPNGPDSKFNNTIEGIKTIAKETSNFLNSASYIPHNNKIEAPVDNTYIAQPRLTAPRTTKDVTRGMSTESPYLNSKDKLGYFLDDIYIQKNKNDKKAQNRRSITKEQAATIKDMVDKRYPEAAISRALSDMLYENYNNSFALGGDLQTHGADWSNGSTHIDEGETHEQNPYGGVQVGVDSQGTPNLVEEGEVIWNDYVYSNRIPVDEATKEKFHINKKRDMTYADLAKKLEKEIEERPNDPISKAGFQSQMLTLQEQQERQKQEMEAERARAAFESLSPEEQVAMMQQAAQQEQMAQEQAMQEQAMVEQAQMEQAEPQQPVEEGMSSALNPDELVATEQQVAAGTPVMAEGGNLYPDGGFVPNAKFAKWWNDYITQPVSSGRIKGDQLDYGKIYEAITGEKGPTKSNDVYDALAKLYDTDSTQFGPFDATTYTISEPSGVAGSIESGFSIPQVTIQPEELDLKPVKGLDYVEVEQPKVAVPKAEPIKIRGKEVVPRYRAEWPRYLGLFGPAVGLGLQTLGVGRPDTSELDAAVNIARGASRMADYQPIGDYLTYRPMDIWAEQNRMDASARATDRAIRNSNSPSRMAGILANGYNSQIALGNLYRKALEYNDALRERTATFNRGSNQFNAEAYNRNSQFNAEMANRNREALAKLALTAADQKMDADAGWYNGIYGNIAGLFRGLGDLGTENYRMNRLAEMGADDIFGTLGNSYTGRKYVKENAKGGKLNRKKGLTF